MYKPKSELCHFSRQGQTSRTLVFLSSVLCRHRLLIKPTDFSGSQGILCGCLMGSLQPCSLLCVPPKTRWLRVEPVGRVTGTCGGRAKALGSIE